MNNPYNHPPFYFYASNYSPYSQPNPIFRYPQYLNNQIYTNVHNPMQTIMNIRRPPIKNAQSSAFIIVEDEPSQTNPSQISSTEPSEKNESPKTFFKNKTFKISQTEYEYLQKKVCEICRKPEHDELLLLCDYCDDGYHTYCLKPILVEVPNEKESWACPLCQQDLENIELLEKLRSSNNCYVVLDPHHKSYMEGLMMNNMNFMNNMNNNNTPIAYKNIQMLTQNNQINNEGCFACKNQFLNEKSESCFSCKKKFHSYCINISNSQAVICKRCEESIISSIPPNFQEYFEKHKSNQNILKSIKPRKKKKSTFGKTSSLFKLHCTSSSSQTLQQKKNLYFYLKARGTEFSDDLVYDHDRCPSTNNFSGLEPGLKELNKANLEIIKQFKELSRHANYPPIMIEEDKIQGFVVKAYEEIHKKTLICEYVGEVDYARNKIFEKSNDSIMMLLRTTRSRTSLVICPKKYANIAKFISGINNFDPSAKLKQNVNSVRLSIDNQARVFLYARRNIKAGETLYYDYNAGGLNEYPTLGFV